MNLETVIGLVSLSFAPITIWLTREQLKRQELKDSTFSLGVKISKDENDDDRKHYLSVKHKGIAPLYQFSVYGKEGDFSKLLEQKAVFYPGDQIESEFLTSGDFEIFYQWHVPARSPVGKREEAYRVRYTSEGTFRERWKEHWWTSMRLFVRNRSPKFVTKRLRKRRTKFPLGKWEPQRERISREGDRPGWP